MAGTSAKRPYVVTQAGMAKDLFLFNTPRTILQPLRDEASGDSVMLRRVTLVERWLGHFKWLVTFMSEKRFSDDYCRRAKLFRATAITYIDQMVRGALQRAHCIIPDRPRLPVPGRPRSLADTQ